MALKIPILILFRLIDGFKAVLDGFSSFQMVLGRFESF